MEKRPNKLHEPVEIWVLVFFLGALIGVPLAIWLIAYNADVIDSYFTRLTVWLLKLPRYVLVVVGVGVLFAVTRRFRQGHKS